MIILRKIDSSPGTLLELTDTPSIYTKGKFLQSTTSGTEWASVSGSGGTSFHSELYELDYASSGHTGFAPTSHSHVEIDITDLDKYTQAEVDSLIASASGTTDHSDLDNLDYTSAGHTGFQPSGNYLTDTEFSTYSGTLQSQIDDKSDLGHIHDDRYYTEAEVDTISGSLQTNIDNTPDILLELTDTPELYDTGKYLRSTSDGTEWATVSGGSGTSNHSELTELDYPSSGHTGFSPDGHLHDDRYYTESEVDTLISGTGQTGQYNIGNGLNSFTVTFDIPYNDTNYDVVGIMLNDIDAAPAKYGYIITATTISNFTVELSDITDTANYKFNWHAGSNSSGGSGGLSWSIITTNTTATKDNGYLINASSGNVTLTLPASPSEGDSVGACDFYNKATTNIITVGRNSNNIEGSSTDLTIDMDGAGFTLVYTDSTRGWEIIMV